MQMNISRGAIAKGLAVIAVVLAVVIIFFSTVYKVDEGERGVVTRNGGFIGIADPGLGVKIPFMDSITEMEIRNMKLDFPVHVYSSDTQQYEAVVAVNYDLNPAEVENIFKKEGIYYADRRLKPLIETVLKEVAGKYSAQRTIQERDIFGAAVREAVREEAKKYGINVTEVQIRNIDFTDQFEKAIETAMLAKAKVEEERNILDQKRIKAETLVVDATAQANAAREEAKGKADAKITEAQAEATRIAKIGEAEADAIRKKADALKNNPELTAYTRALAAQRWDGKLPNNFIPGSALPIVDVSPK
jgi:regulator of protease activity HflC (stomatin/prohibitin superfamily)